MDPDGHQEEQTIDNYDSLGRVLQSTQITGGQPYMMIYTYDLAGDLMTETYPSGRVVDSAYDGAGRLNSLTGAPPGSSSSKNYATQFTYTAPGGVASLNLGNNLWEHTTFNSRLQPMQMGLGTSSTDSSMFGLLYGFGTTNNNGNVLSEAITPASGTTFNQTFTYDQVNRLQTATEMNGSATNWSRTFSYDVFGNMWVSATGGTASMPLNPLTPTAQSAYSTANNNQLIASTYDAAGNQSIDGQGGQYFYDGDNKMTRCTVNGVSSSYQYDGNGRRIAKTVSGLTTTFVYNSGGDLIAEYGGPGPTPSNTGTSYLTTDHLGSTRVVTNNSQAVVSRHDYEPFGGEITLLAGGRTGTETGGLNYQGPDDTRQKFTSKERDNESNLDFFEARYFSAFQGRFTSPDEFTGGPRDIENFADIASSNPTFYADQSDPQSLNKYQYCYGNPLRFVDPDGHEGLWDKIKATVNGAANAYAEDNGLKSRGGPENALGRALGHVEALAQAAGELVTAGAAITGGGSEAVVTSPAAGTGIGAVIPAAGAAVVVGGAVVGVHGGAVAINTIHNIFAKKGNSGGKSKLSDIKKEHTVEGTQDQEAGLKDAQSKGKLIEDTTKSEQNSKNALRNYKEQHNAGNEDPDGTKSHQ